MRAFLFIALLIGNFSVNAGEGDPLHPSNAIIEPKCFVVTGNNYCVAVWDFSIVGHTFGMATDRDGTWKFVGDFTHINLIYAYGGVKAYWDIHITSWNEVLLNASAYPEWEIYTHERLTLDNGQLSIDHQ